ncbi:hypothetical protein LK12_23165 [Novosphingobium malaysiense]|uniref:Major facilitator superfamily (MFS) profile domain-containing protein n=2 Tax=Novosphingobium malaysiense TaxID=1348853 RepID=A0A0B1ZEQ9_9SPHN|nr:hypothetical protein LK12_23165 [Novosphingobium malaysiense]
MVAIAAVSYILLYGITYSSFGLYIVPVSDEFGLSRADMNVAMILLMLGGGLASPAVGWLVDRFPLKLIMLVSAIAIGAALAVLGLSHSLWLDAAMVLIPLPVALAGAGYLGMSALIARWFVHQRGRAMALSMLGMAVGGIIVPPALAWLIETTGWRYSLLVGAVAVVAILIPLFALVRAPEAKDETAAPAGNDVQQEVQSERTGAPLAIGEIFRMPLFWTILLAACLSMSVMQSASLSIVPVATEAGISMLEAAFLLSLAGAGTTLGNVLVAAIGDRIDRATILAGMFLILALGNLIFLNGKAYYLLVSASVALGLAGAMTPVFFAFVADRFGSNSFGTVQGLMFPATSLATAAAMRFSGEVFDRTGSYSLMFKAFTALAIAAALLILTSRFVAARSNRQHPAGPPLQSQ